MNNQEHNLQWRHGGRICTTTVIASFPRQAKNDFWSLRYARLRKYNKNKNGEPVDGPAETID